MDLQEIKKQWNHGLNRIKKAETLAENNPKLFDMYIKEFSKICSEMSRLMSEYKKHTGNEIPKNEFENGFKNVTENSTINLMKGAK